MVRYVDREPSSNASTVVCFRCGGNHFAKNKQDPSKNCKMPPVWAKTVASYPPASVPASVNASAGEAALQDMWAGFVRAEKDRRAREKKRSSVFPSSQRSSVAAQAGLGEDALAQLALVSAKLAKMQEQLNLLLSKDSLSRVDASVQTDVFAVAVQTVSRQLGVADACVGTACFAAAQTDAVPDGLDVAVQWPGTVSVDVCTDAVQHSDCGVQAGPVVVDAASLIVPCVMDVSVQSEPVTVSVSSNTDTIPTAVPSSLACASGAPIAVAAATCAPVAAAPVAAAAAVRFVDTPCAPAASSGSVTDSAESSIGARVWSRAFFRRHRPVFDPQVGGWVYQDCVDCHTDYAMSEEQMDMWLARGWQHPVRCQDCRDANSARRRRAAAV